MHFTNFLTLLALPLVAISAPLSPRQGWGAVTNAKALKFYEPNWTKGSTGYSDPSTYTCYQGTWDRFPAISKWKTFNSMWEFLKQTALLKIGQNTPQEVQAVYNGIQQVSKETKVDARIILAVIIQESTGNVRAPCTNNGVVNCGMMQSHNPIIQAYDPNNMQASITQQVCPLPFLSFLHPVAKLINASQIRDGVQGTSGAGGGAGLVQLLNNAALTDGNIYKALRAYNSGSLNKWNLSDGMGATPSYCSDIGNYLQGWQGWGSPARDTCSFMH